MFKPGLSTPRPRLTLVYLYYTGSVGICQTIFPCFFKKTGTDPYRYSGQKTKGPHHWNAALLYIGRLLEWNEPVHKPGSPRRGAVVNLGLLQYTGIERICQMILQGFQKKPDRVRLRIPYRRGWRSGSAPLPSRGAKYRGTEEKFFENAFFFLTRESNRNIIVLAL